jgi:hypothetical protein
MLPAQLGVPFTTGACKVRDPAEPQKPVSP